MPYTIFTSPEIGGFGLTEKKAKLIYSDDNVKSIVMKKTPYLEKLIRMNPLDPEPPLDLKDKMGGNTEKISRKVQNFESSMTEGKDKEFTRNNLLKIIYETKSGKDKIKIAEEEGRILLTKAKSIMLSKKTCPLIKVTGGKSDEQLR